MFQKIARFQIQCYALIENKTKQNQKEKGDSLWVQF